MRKTRRGASLWPAWLGALAVAGAFLAGCAGSSAPAPLAPEAGVQKAVAASAAPAPTPDPFIDSILGLMTLEQKVGQLTQMQGRWGETGPTVREGGFDDVREGRVGSFLGMYAAEITREIQRVATGRPRPTRSIPPSTSTCPGPRCTPSATG